MPIEEFSRVSRRFLLPFRVGACAERRQCREIGVDFVCLMDTKADLRHHVHRDRLGEIPARCGC